MKKKILVCLLLVVVMVSSSVPVFAADVYSFRYTENTRITINSSTQVVGWNVLGGFKQTPDAMRVQVVQLILKRAGYYSGAIDGSCGPATKAAIRSYQSRNGLAVDGCVGPATWRKMYSLYVLFGYPLVTSGGVSG